LSSREHSARQARGKRPMGEHQVELTTDHKKVQNFLARLLEDLDALERMIAAGLFDQSRNIGCELEMFLVDEALRPAPVAAPILAAAKDPRLTTELARFNLEANGTPLPFHGGCLRAMQNELEDLVHEVEQAAKALGADVVLTG